jgi:hypothetical protein
VANTAEAGTATAARYEQSVAKTIDAAAYIACAAAPGTHGLDAAPARDRAAAVEAAFGAVAIWTAVLTLAALVDLAQKRFMALGKSVRRDRPSPCRSRGRERTDLVP